MTSSTTQWTRTPDGYRSTDWRFRVEREYRRILGVGSQQWVLYDAVSPTPGGLVSGRTLTQAKKFADRRAAR